MQAVTNEQIYDRWEQVPEVLKEAFFSLENGEVIWKACEDTGLSEDIIDNVLIVVGNILLGFTHVNDLAKELQSIPGMDPKAVDPIIFQIDKRIFEPIKGGILQLYGVMAGTGPRIVAEAGGELPASKPAEQGAPAMIPTEEANIEIRKVRIGEEPAAPIAAPTIIHSEAELKPIAQKKRPLSSFGGMFGFRQAQDEKKEGGGVAAQVGMIEGLGKKEKEVAKTEQQPVRVVHYTSAKAPEDIFGQPQGAVGQAVAPTAPERGQVVDFEPKVVDLTTHDIPAGSAQGVMTAIPVPPMPEAPAVAQEPIAPPQVTAMKTPQRMEAAATQAPIEKEPKLAEIPVNDEIVDLRMLERVDQPGKKET